MADSGTKGECLPADWEDNDRMNFMFSAFPESREVNPKHWDSKLNFWSKAISEKCEHHEEIFIDFATLKTRFTRNSLTPLGLRIVLKEMTQQGKLMRKEDFMTCNNDGWVSWSFGLAKRSFWWGVHTVMGGDDELNLDDKFILVDAAKENAERLLAKHYANVQCETTDYVIPWNVMKMRCKKFDDEALEVLIGYLQQQSKAVIYVTSEGEKARELFSFRSQSHLEVIKFARKGEVKVTAVSDNDINIVRCRLQAASFAKEGSRTKALKLLRRKELRQRTLDKAIADLNSFEEILHRIQNAHTDRMVIEALRAGTAALKGGHSEMTIDKVEDVIDDLNEGINESQDINSAILEGNVRLSEASGIGPDEMEELERELESLDIGKEDPGIAAGYQYNSTSSRVAQRPGPDTELPKLPPVPSYGPDASENSSTRQKTKSLEAS
ncbi:Charged multivesicular body protein 7 [Stylophora pistillata]|uniref:Charged multivesicular body protein 7 n=1 Tax=Stylophora pistillata TaxID=50429 RepID=A0A2B4RX33_STYPI|nr:Charged multivesicular body protein 7 [Stylophora pistillata]